MLRGSLQIGIVTSDGSDPMAIVAAWHPLRLAERRAKILDLARFIDTVLTTATPSSVADSKPINVILFETLH